MPTVSLHVSGQTQYWKQVCVNQAMECFNMVMSSTAHPHVLSPELLRLPVQVTENASWQFQVNPQITSGKSRLFQTDGCVSSMNFSEFFFIKKNFSYLEMSKR